MIITRRRDAAPLNDVLSVPYDKWLFSQSIAKSKKGIDIVYYDKGVNFKEFAPGSLSAHRKIGELERKNIPFILLIDRECELATVDGNNPLVVNANYLTYDRLSDILGQNTEGGDKSKLFRIMFDEYVRDNTDKSLAACFSYFLEGGKQDGTITKDLIFLLMNAKTGLILNGNPSIGVSYDRDKVWYYNEEYDYDMTRGSIEQPISEAARFNGSTNSLKNLKAFMEARDKKLEKRPLDFDEVFKNKTLISWKTLKHYSEEDLAKIIETHPKLFSDMVKKKFSYYDESSYSAKEEAYIKLFAEPEHEEDEDDDQNTFIEQYREEEYDAPIGTKCCYACLNYFPERDMETVEVNEDDGPELVDICADCKEAAKE
jgi:hypothetical protein